MAQPLHLTDRKMRKLLQINPVLRTNTSTGRIMQEIGELAMQKLKDIDEVAYVRFASVYRQFKDINAFMDELSQLLRKR